MIIHYKDDFSRYKVICHKILKYTDEFSFIPIKVVTSKEQGIFQTPLLFSPYGIQTRGHKKTIDLSFMNRVNDPTLEVFYNHLIHILNIVQYSY